MANYYQYQVFRDGRVLGMKGKFLKGSIDGGYKRYLLKINGNPIKIYAHILVWKVYGNEYRSGYHVDHIDNNKLNNHIDNLQLLTPRENKQKDIKYRKNKLLGTFYESKLNKWRSRIYINGKVKYLGLYNTEIEAHNAYKKELNKDE